MKRRSFCGAALSSAALAALPRSGLLAASGASLRPTDIDELRASLAGRLLLPEQPEYESARKVWNGAFDRRPALIARCSNTNDVVRTVTFAREHQLLVAVRGLPSMLIYRGVLEPRERLQMTLLTATALPLLVALAAIGLDSGHMLPENAAALVGAGVLSVMFFPAAAVQLSRARHPHPEAASP